MRLPPILQGDSFKRLLQGAFIGFVGTMIIGFNWGGWSLGSTANKLAEQRADSAVIAALTPICVQNFLKANDGVANLATLKAISSTYEQKTYVEKSGWATRLGATSPDSPLARACAEKLTETKAAAQ
jgi:hypothetical protein